MEANETICPVLIVDDNNDLCKILAMAIRRICPVHVEHNLTNAERYLTGLHRHIITPKILLLDNNLPDGVGIKYIKHALDLYPDIKVVLMTADTSEGLKEKAISEGAAYFIAKPFRAAAINHVILSICPELRAA